jgi:hypothetical protein
MTLFTRNLDFHIDHSGDKPLIHLAGNFNRALELNPNAAKLFGTMVKLEHEGLGLVHDFEVPAYERVSCENGMWSMVQRHQFWRERDEIWQRSRL